VADSAQQRAASAEDAIMERHVRRVWAVPGTALGVVSWPGGVADRAFVRWKYWWQAHLLDCLVDAQMRAPDLRRRRLIAAVTRGLRLRNLGAWTNAYYDDQAWLGLALLRASAVGVPRRRAVQILAGALASAASAAPSAALPWRRGDTYRNVPANAPAGLLLARLGRLGRAQAIADWIDAELVDSDSGLVLDGVYDGRPPDRALYTYCQGAVLGLETELALRTGHPRHAARVCRIVAAVQERMATAGVLHGCGTGDGGLFAGIAARYLALVGATLPGIGPAQRHARAAAGELVRASAQAAWVHRWPFAEQPRFGADWSVPAGDPPGDLSVQLSAWMLLEAHWTLTATGCTVTPSGTLD
jgi:predicted alpha-1,6-mannanase (GH76 family)